MRYACLRFDVDIADCTGPRIKGCNRVWPTNETYILGEYTGVV